MAKTKTPEKPKEVVVEDEEPSDAVAQAEQQETEDKVQEFPFEIFTPQTIGGQIKLLIYADPGVGKTFFLGTADGDPRLTPALLVDTEGGTMTIRDKKGIDVIRVRSYDDIVKLIQHLRMPDHSKCKHRKWKAIFIDSLSELQKQIMAEIVKTAYAQNPGRHDPDIPEMRDWGKNAERVRKVVRAFRDLEGYHIIFTTLMKETKNDSTGEVTIRPGLPGQLAGDIPGFIDIVGFLQIVRKEEHSGETGEEDEEKPKQKKKTVIVRRMIVQPITRAVTKDRSDNLGVALEDPTLPRMLDLILGEGDTDGN